MVSSATKTASAPVARPRLVYLLSVAQRRVHAFVQDRTGGHSPARAGLLLALTPEGGTPMIELGRVLDLGAPAVSNLVERAVKAGLVRRRPDPEDGRAWLVELTPAGLAARKEAALGARALMARLTDGFTDEELAVVARWLESVRSKLPREDDEDPTRGSER